MMINLLGEFIQTNEDLARKIVQKGLSVPSIRIDVIKFNKIDRSVSIRLYEELDLGEVFIPQVKYDYPGIYSIFEGQPNKSNCLYVGTSNSEKNGCSNRIYRFVKEILDCSRDDENHPAAKKARFGKINPMNLYCKILLKKDYPFDDDLINDDIMDEYVAPILNSKFNKRIKH